MTAGGNGGVCMKPPMPPNFSEVTGHTELRRRLDEPFRRGLLRPEHAQQPSAPRPRPDAAPSHKDSVRLRLRSRRDVHVVRGHELGRVPGNFQGATIAGNRQSTPHHPPSHSGDAATNNWLNQINAFYSNATATALQEFVTQPDVDGGKLIDNTIIVYLTEVARAYDHNQQNMPLIVFGGKNTGLKGGTFLKVTGGPLPQQTERLRQPALQRPLAHAAAEVRRGRQAPDGRHRFAGNRNLGVSGRADVHRGASRPVLVAVFP